MRYILLKLKTMKYILIIALLLFQIGVCTGQVISTGYSSSETPIYDLHISHRHDSTDLDFYKKENLYIKRLWAAQDVLNYLTADGYVTNWKKFRAATKKYQQIDSYQEAQKPNVPDKSSLRQPQELKP